MKSTALAAPAPTAERATGLVRAGFDVLLVVVPLLLIPALVAQLFRSHTFAYDFHTWYWPAGNRVLHGLSPYALPVDSAFKYPAAAVPLILPFALLPHRVADWSFTLLVLAAVPITLRLLEVRDWRLYAVAMLWPAVVYGWETANVTLLLLVGVAAAWRYRDRAAVVGVILALLVSIKIFLIPLAVWLIATRRWAALAWAAGATVVVNAMAWSALGIHDLSQYVRLLHGFTPSAERRGFSLISLLLHQGVGQAGAYAVALALAAGAAAVAFVAGRRGNDVGALAACIGASLLASPLVESHYLALLIVPLAVVRPRLSPVWALPAVLWVAPVDHAADWQKLLALVVCAGVLAVTANRPSRADNVRSLSPTLV